MYLFIFESIGTSELLLIGAVALIVFGPRKLPQMARTLGKAMADFKNTTNEFKNTWEREANFEDTNLISRENARQTPDLYENQTVERNTNEIIQPEIKEIDPTQFTQPETTENKIETKKLEFAEKQNWL